MSELAVGQGINSDTRQEVGAKIINTPLAPVRPGRADQPPRRRPAAAVAEVARGAGGGGAGGGAVGRAADEGALPAPHPEGPVQRNGRGVRRRLRVAAALPAGLPRLRHVGAGPDLRGVLGERGAGAGRLLLQGLVGGRGR